jgi:hypothetical protein
MSVTRTPVLVGRDQHRSRQFAMLAVGIFLACSMGYTVPVIVGWNPLFYLGVVASFVIVVGVAIVHAYLNDGLLVTTLLTGAVGAAGIPAQQLATRLDPVIAVTPVESLVLTLWFGGLGLGAFVIGAGTRRVVTYTRMKSVILVTKR